MRPVSGAIRTERSQRMVRAQGVVWDAESNPGPEMPSSALRFLPHITRAGPTAIALVAAAAAAIGAPTAAASVFPDTSDGIHLNLVFDYKVRPGTPTNGLVDLVWGANRPRGPLGDVHRRYVPFDRDATRQSRRWWRMHHPSWVVYRCD